MENICKEVPLKDGGVQEMKKDDVFFKSWAVEFLRRSSMFAFQFTRDKETNIWSLTDLLQGH